MNVKDYKDGKLINLSKAFGNRQKFLYGFYFLSFFVGGTFILSFIFSEDITPGMILFICVAVAVLYFAAYRFVNKALLAEQLFINKKELQLIKRGLFTSRKAIYDITKISRFRHLAKPALSKHPLAGESFDYLGFQTEQQVINEMHGDNRVSFDYDGRMVTFGENIYSWDFEELEILLYDITGNDFRYTDEFEKTLKPTDESQETT